MSFIDISKAALEAKPFEPLEEGIYKFRVSGVKVNYDKGFVVLRFEPVDHPMGKEVTCLLNLPGAGRTDREENDNVLRFVSCYKCFGLDPFKPGGYDLTETFPRGLQEAVGWLSIGPPVEDSEYGLQNKVKREGFVEAR